MDDDGAQRMRMAAHHAALTAALLRQASVAPPHGSWPVDHWPVLASMAAAAQLGGAAVPMQPATTYAASLSQLPHSVPYPSGSWVSRPAAGNPQVLGSDWSPFLGGWTSSGLLHPSAALPMNVQPPLGSVSMIQPSRYFGTVNGHLGVLEGEDRRAGLRPLGGQQAAAGGASDVAAASPCGPEATSAADLTGMPRDHSSPIGPCRHAFRTGNLHAFSPYLRSRASSQNASPAPVDTCLDLSVPRASDSFVAHRPSPVITAACDVAPTQSVPSETASSLAVMTSGSGGSCIRTVSAKSERGGSKKAPIPVGIAVAWQRRQEPSDPLTRETASAVSKGDSENRLSMPTASAEQRLSELVDDCATTPIRSPLCLENSLLPSKTAQHCNDIVASTVGYEGNQAKVKDAANPSEKAVIEGALPSESSDPIALQAAISLESMAQAAVDLRRKRLERGRDSDDDDDDREDGTCSLSDYAHSAMEYDSEKDENSDGPIDKCLASNETTALVTAHSLSAMAITPPAAASSSTACSRKRKERRRTVSKKKKHAYKKRDREAKKARRKHRKRLEKESPPMKKRAVEVSAEDPQERGFSAEDREPGELSPLPIEDRVASKTPAENERRTTSDDGYNDFVHVRYDLNIYNLTDDQSLLALCKSLSERKLALEEAKDHYKGQQLRLDLELAQMEEGQQAATSGHKTGREVASSSGIGNSRTDLRLSVEDLTEGARLLMVIRGLPYEGTVVCLEPPSVYGVVLASQRSARPRVYAREDLLRDAVRDVQPTRAEDLRHGARVCAYWSSQFDCLYPGVVVKVLRPDNASPAAGCGLNQAARSKLSKAKSGRTLVEITFDDNDSGTFALEQIRMLPADFPHSPMQFEFANDDDMLSVVPAERRLRSSSSSGGSAAAAVGNAPSSANAAQHSSSGGGSSGCLPLTSVTSPQSRRHPRSCRNRQTAESSAAASRVFSESDDEPLTMLSKHAGVPSTLPSGGGSEWVWSGSPIRAQTAAGSHSRRRSDKVFYPAIRRGSDLLKIGDRAVFARREENMPPFVGTILNLWQGRRRMTVRVQWFYHPEEIEDNSMLHDRQNMIGALFESEHQDEVNVQSILNRCEVLPLDIYRERRLHLRSSADVMRHTIFCIVGSYDAVGGRITNLLDTAAVATEETLETTP